MFSIIKTPHFTFEVIGYKYLLKTSDRKEIRVENTVSEQ